MLFWILLSIIGSGWGSEGEKHRSKVVSTVLNSKWRETDFISEGMEFLASSAGRSDAFWELTETLVNGERDKLSDQELYDQLIHFSTRYLPWTEVNMLKFALSLRTESPKIEMFQQIAHDRGVDSLGCTAVVERKGKLSCSFPDGKSDGESGDEPEVLKIDHVYPHASQNAPETVILYGLVGTPEMTLLHDKLKTQASAGNIRYIFRPYIHKRMKHKVRLSGYGVELQIKSTEYKAQDDRKVQGSEDEDLSSGVDHSSGEINEVLNGFDFSKLVKNFPEDKEKLEEFKQHLKDQNNDMAPMKVWQLQDLSMQATDRIMNSPKADRLNVLTDISQNFPSHARSLTRIKVSKEILKEVAKNSDSFASNMNINPSDAALFINGIHFDMDYTDIFTIFEALKSEGKVLDGLGRLGLSEEQANKLISLDFEGDKQQPYGIDIRDLSIKWINDIEKDKLYAGWPSSVEELLRPTFPGMLRSIRKNFFNILLMCNPSKVHESGPIMQLLQSFYVHRTPTRIGFVFAVNSDPAVSGYEDSGVALLEAFNYIAEKKSLYEAFAFLTDVYSKVADSPAEDVPFETVSKMFTQATKVKDLDSVFGAESEYDVGRQASKDFIDRSGFKSFPQVLMNGIPMESKNLNAEDFEDSVMRALMRETNKLQKAVYHAELKDSDNVMQYLMEQSFIMPRLSDRILKTDNESDKKNQLDMTSGDHSLTELTLEKFAALDKSSMTATIADNCKYLSLKDDYKLMPLTSWVVADLETLAGRALLRESLSHIKYSKQMRIGIIINNANGVGMLTRAIYLAFNTLPNAAAKTLLSKILKENTIKALLGGKKSFADYDIPGADLTKFARTIAETPKEQIYEIHSIFANEVLGFKPGQNGVIINGRIVGPFEPQEIFGQDDFNLLDKYSMSQFGDKLVNSLYEAMDIKGSSGKKISDIAMKVTSLILSRTSQKSRTQVSYYGVKKSVIVLDPILPEKPSFDITAIIDPVSQGAQKVSSLLSVLQKVLNVRIRVFLNAAGKHSEMPLKSYFRTVLEPEITFDPKTGRRGSGPIARFTNLPEEPIFTMHYHIPDNWLVEPVKSVYDMDNIKLQNVEGSIVHSEYELENLLVEGHCFETMTGNSPRGLQLTLGTKSSPVTMDTIVMANLGYLQLKGNPGRWFMTLREGRSSEIFDIVSQEGAENLENNTIQVLVSSFQSTIVRVRVSKKPDKRNEELLTSGSEEDESDGGLWNSITSTFTGSSKKNEEGNEESNDKDANTLNIFCLASGHLYERLLKIMMLSTIRKTDAKVKFWILKSYLSPSLKQFLPEYSKRYGFDYEYVQYKWPRWLNQQKEKQRIIWGYKILFLDVMFPLDVKKIIFVDTDQIVRADLTELRDMDLGGAPYGYTPFCDSNKEMDGFRFWKSGYWRSHLAGRSYHISALYVVDLVKFRQIAAGDRLRGQYQALSQDPNSLANLDQDLPNNMIHQVPIKSLPQEWLWCETWCDKDSLRKAKSIDLCNNPLTKESKLDAARRIVKEWPELDDEMQKLTDEIFSNSKKTLHDKKEVKKETPQREEL